MKLKDVMRSNKGSAVSSVIAVAAVVMFIILPLFVVVVEKYIFNVKVNKMKDAIDIANLATYNAISTKITAKGDAALALEDDIVIFKEILAENLNLNSDMTPNVNSIAEDTVNVIEFKSYLYSNTTFPATCLQGNNINRPTIHSVIEVPIRPTLLSRIVLDALGRSTIDIKIHVDTELPINN